MTAFGLRVLTKSPRSVCGDGGFCNPKGRRQEGARSVRPPDGEAPRVQNGMVSHRQRASDLEQAAPAELICASCGRRVTWRVSWARDWANVKYCSAACRRHGIDDTDRELESTIARLLSTRAADASICPTDVARAVGGETWRELMEPVRRAARRMVAAGQLQVTQGSSVVDPSTAKGPIRLRRPR